MDLRKRKYRTSEEYMPDGGKTVDIDLNEEGNKRKPKPKQPKEKITHQSLMDKIVKMLEDFNKNMKTARDDEKPAKNMA